MSQQPASPVTVTSLRHQLESVCAYQRNVWRFEALLLLVVAVLPIVLVGMLLDNILHLHWAFRMAILLVLVAVVAGLVARAVRLLRSPLDVKQIAITVERQMPEFDNELINSLLLAGEADERHHQLIQDVIDQATAHSSRSDLKRAVPRKRLHMLAGIGAAMCLGVVGYAVFSPAAFGNALARLVVPFAAPPPLTKTRIDAVTPGDVQLLLGDPLVIQAAVSGRMPEEAQVIIEAEDQPLQIAVMAPGSAPTPGSAPQTFVAEALYPSTAATYYVRAGDARSKSFTVRIHHRPVVSELTVVVEPPKYTGRSTTTQTGGTIKALAGSNVTLKITSSKPLGEASVVGIGEKPLAMHLGEPTHADVNFTLTESGRYHIALKDTMGFENTLVEYDVQVIDDQAPQITLESPPAQISVNREDTIPFEVVVTDEYGIENVQLIEQLKQEGDEPAVEKVLKSWVSHGQDVTRMPLIFDLPVNTLSLAPGGEVRLVVTAKDFNDVTGPGVARSRMTVVRMITTEQAKQQQEEAVKASTVKLSQIVNLQRRNLAQGRTLAGASFGPGKPGTLDASAITGMGQLQATIRQDTGVLLEQMPDTVPIKATVRGLYEKQMVDAVASLRDLTGGTGASDSQKAFEAALLIQQDILTQLTGKERQLKKSVDASQMRDLFAALDTMLRKQRGIRDNAADSADTGVNLATKQKGLADDARALGAMLTEQATVVAQSDSQLGEKFDQAVSLLQDARVRVNMLLSAAKLGADDLPGSLPPQDKVIDALSRISDLLREPVAAKAVKRLEAFKDVMDKTKAKLEEIDKTEMKIKQLTEELKRSEDATGEKTLAEKDAIKQQLEDYNQKLKDMVETVAKDLDQFPDIPVANEMVAMSTEVFEDVDQPEGSESEGAKEIAVDRDEGLAAKLKADAKKGLKDRVADQEMWLHEKPDTIAWKQEGLDKTEMPPIPLTDLPEQLEDLVGDLMEQQEDIADEAQDSTSNLTNADPPAGWDVLDGPISSFSAKGKSGNTKPNDNEMMGRSGSGRSGNASGEMSEGYAKDLEGSKTKARRTNDPSSQGQVEEENPNSEANATGGGKQSGAGGEGGLSGSSPPRNELGMRGLAGKQEAIRRNTESLYSKATLMYLPTGELDQAILLMRKAEAQAAAWDERGFAETQQRIARALSNTRQMLSGQPPVKVDARDKLPMQVREQILDAQDEAIPTEYEPVVAEYYKAIADGMIK